jgi:hypothetical protein
MPLPWIGDRLQERTESRTSLRAWQKDWVSRLTTNVSLRWIYPPGSDRDFPDKPH